MCMQCMMGAMTAGAGASGIRAWLATRGFRWLTPRRLRVASFGLIATAFVLSTVVLGGSA